MTTLFLSTVGGNIGAATLGPIGQFAGAELGTYVGARLDSLIFGLDKTLPTVQGPRLNDLNIQTSTYGKVIPIIYGNSKIAGNIIWAQPLKEKMERKATTIGKWGPHTTHVRMDYFYYATLAIAICEGVVNELHNIYANEQLLDMSSLNYRFYSGTEEQQPDPLIQSLEGQAPGYRGMAYIVFEDFPLAEYGNHIPNFTFELACNLHAELAKKIAALNVIPGSGEFVYDTHIQSKSSGERVGEEWVEAGMAQRINQNSNRDRADPIIALDNLQNTLPKVKWLAVVVNWFADNLDIATCDIYPAVEYRKGACSVPDDWQVANIKRQQGRLISRDAQGHPLYGGTVNDASLTRYLQELKRRGYKVMLYPMLLLDLPGKPWRGTMTGDSKAIGGFFAKYKPFIEHYATLGKEYIDAFIIGSELKGITQINRNGKYPAVTALVKLAKSIKEIVGEKTIVSYAADWSEYHSHNGIYYLDELWASKHIDVVGIDAYFPLTDRPQPEFGFSYEEIVQGWTSGEGYDYYYQDSHQHRKKFSDAKWAWKNIEKWWAAPHDNSPWQAKMKKIWFTEYGFPSVDGCTNQPNVFVDRTSQDSQLPIYSHGKIDFKAQALAIKATIDKWHGSPMVENMFLWAWDARPFPYFPSLSKVWADSSAWPTGHWVQGKLSLVTLQQVITAILHKAGYTEKEFTCQQLSQPVDGFILNESYTAQSALAILRQAYFFEVVKYEAELLFTPKKSQITRTIDVNDLVLADYASSVTSIEDIQRLPHRMEIIYLDRQYEISSTYAERMQVNHKKVKTIFLPMILDDQYARQICAATLYNLWHHRISYNFNLPMSYADLQVSDVLKITDDKVVQIIEIDYGEVLHIKAVAYNHELYQTDITQLTTPSAITKNFAGPTICEILDLPINSGEVSVCKNGLDQAWRGASLYIAHDINDDLQPALNMYGNSTRGTTLNRLATGPAVIIDEGSEVTVLLRGGTLESISDTTLLSGGNLALLGDEIIQFRDAEFLGDYKYRLSGLLRGRYSTEYLIDHHQSGESFILLDDALSSLPIAENMLGREIFYKAISYGEFDGEIKSFTYQNNALKPFSVVYVQAKKQNSGDIEISWYRRSRVDSNLRDYVGVPLAEEYERYDVEIYQGKEAVRTINVQDKTSCLYPQVEQITDFGRQLSALEAKIYQLSAMVGRGYGEKLHLNVI